MQLRRKYYNETVTLYTDQGRFFEKYETEKVERRNQADITNIQKVCAKYLGSINPWLPTKSKININNFYLDRGRSLGWCFNPKVSHKHNQS